MKLKKKRTGEKKTKPNPIYDLKSFKGIQLKNITSCSLLALQISQCDISEREWKQNGQGQKWEKWEKKLHSLMAPGTG